MVQEAVGSAVTGKTSRTEREAGNGMSPAATIEPYNSRSSSFRGVVQMLSGTLNSSAVRFLIDCSTTFHTYRDKRVATQNHGVKGFRNCGSVGAS